MDRETHIQLAAVTDINYPDLISSHTKLAITSQKLCLLHAAIGLSSELGELLQAIQDGNKLNLIEEVGDMLWYISRARSIVSPNNYSRWTPVFDDDEDCYKYVSGSVARFCNQVKRHVFYGKELDSEDVTLMRASLSSIEAALDFLVSIDIAREKNIAKLKARYGDKFSQHAALNRNLNKELKALESGNVE